MRAAVVIAVALVAGSCGYFNSLYNANRSFAVAERASRTGDQVTAAREYRAAIDRAAVSYRRYPDGRWADDALLLLGRARFALGEHDAAAAAMRTLLAQSSDRSMRSLAHGYLGASLFALREPAQAGVHLDSAAAVLAADTEEGAFVRLWRARAAFAGGRSDAAWADLTAAAGSGRTARDAAFEGIGHAVQLRDSARVLEFMQLLARSRGLELPRVDSLLRSIGHDWSPALAFHASSALMDADVPADVRDAISLRRARLAVDADNPEAALELAMRVAGAVNLGAGSRARLLAAQIHLARAQSTDELEQVRTLLLPAYDDRAALDLRHRVRAAQMLLQAGTEAGSSLSLFAAAELLRDDAGAPLLARRVFLDFAASDPRNVWAGKAALAAHQIAPSVETSAALDRLADNPYVRTARGGHHVPGDIDRAEERLAFGIGGLRSEALADAVRQDVAIGRAVAVLDSTRTAALNDSIRIACGVMLDSLSLAGIRADSTRSACLRGDSARVRFVILADTTLLRDSTGGVDPRGPSRGRTAPPDTTRH